MSPERPDEISFVATLPTSAGAISIDGGSGEGGRIKLDIPGTHLAQLIALATLRGKQLAVTIALQQTELDLTHAGDAPDDQASVLGPALEQQGAGVLLRNESILRAAEQLAPAEGSEVTSVEITAAGRTVRLTPETRKKVQRVRRGLLAQRKAKTRA